VAVEEKDEYGSAEVSTVADVSTTSKHTAGG
jgi:hypothetical protein